MLTNVLVLRLGLTVSQCVNPFSKHNFIFESNIIFIYIQPSSVTELYPISFSQTSKLIQHAGLFLHSHTYSYLDIVSITAVENVYISVFSLTHQIISSVNEKI